MTNINRGLKSRGIIANKGPYSQSYGGITDSMNMSLSKLREMVKDREASWGHKDHDQIMGSQRVSDRTTTKTTTGFSSSHVQM